MPRVQLKLGDFIFQAFEVPENIGGGGEQMLAVHKMPGGLRVIDAMGRDDRDLTWSGRILGTDAIQRAVRLDEMRMIGKQFDLTWSEYRYKVVIKNFEWEYELAFNITYKITCVIVDDLAHPTPRADITGPDDSIRNINGVLKGAGGLLSDIQGAVKDAVGVVTDAVDSVVDFVKAPLNVIEPIVGEVTQAQNMVVGAIADVTSNLAGIASLGGILPNQVSASILNIGSQAINTADLSHLNVINSGLGMLDSNLRNLSGIGGASAGIPDLLSAVGNVPTVIGDVGGRVLVAGGNLFDIATQAYGDPSKWTGIAKANNISDPFISGEMSLIIPKNSSELSDVNA